MQAGDCGIGVYKRFQRLCLIAEAAIAMHGIDKALAGEQPRWSYREGVINQQSENCRGKERVTDERVVAPAMKIKPDPEDSDHRGMRPEVDCVPQLDLERAAAQVTLKGRFPEDVEAALEANDPEGI